MSEGHLAKKRAPAYIFGTASGSVAEFHHTMPSTGCDSPRPGFFDDENAWTGTVAGILTPPAPLATQSAPARSRRIAISASSRVASPSTSGK
jgi:hypothetical protein